MMIFISLLISLFLALTDFSFSFQIEIGIITSIVDGDIKLAFELLNTEMM